MSSARHKVIHLHHRDPQEALERLNRVTGLRFSRWPESLAPKHAGEEFCQHPADAEGECTGAKLSAS
jgi:hypothetical protein